MTTAELIELLTQCPPDAEVVVGDGMSWSGEVESVVAERRSYDNGYRDPEVKTYLTV
jgi:hypothetical protein